MYIINPYSIINICYSYCGCSFYICQESMCTIVVYAAMSSRTHTYERIQVSPLVADVPSRTPLAQVQNAELSRIWKCVLLDPAHPMPDLTQWLSGPWTDYYRALFHSGQYRKSIDIGERQYRQRFKFETLFNIILQSSC